SPSEGIYPNGRSGPRLQKVERVAHPEAFALEVGRVGGSCLEEDPTKTRECILAKATMSCRSQPQRASVASRRRCFGTTPKTRLEAFLSNDSRQKHKRWCVKHKMRQS